MQEGILYCPDATPNLFGLFDTSIAPSLLFFSYIPISLLCLIIGIFVWSKAKKDRRNIWFLIMNVLFVLWIANVFIQWLAAPAILVEISARLNGVLELPIFLAAFTFLISLIPNLPGKQWWLAGSWLLLLPVVGMVHTGLTVTDFDLEACEAAAGSIWYWYIYPVEFILAIATFILGIHTSKYTLNEKERQAQRLVTAGLTLFMIIFAASGIYGDITENYEINLIGPLGMLAMIIIIGHSIVKYEFGNLKVMAAQMFVVILLFFTGASFFITDIDVLRVIQGFTFVIAFVVGYLLIINVQKEMHVRESIDALNKQLQTQNGQLQEVNQQKTEFVSFATHQLRSPLTAMRGYASMLLEGDFGELAPDAKHAVHQIHDASRSMTAIVDDYLNVSRLELKTMKFTFEPVCIGPLIKSVAEELEPTIKDSGLSFSIELPTGTEPVVMADAEKIRQVITNLIDNAIKYTEKGSIHVHLYEHNLGSMVCEITDTGIGFNDNTKDKLFQKFSRAGGNVAGIKGTGLGLYVAREIIKAHKGRVWAASPGAGKGSTFAFELPKR